MGDVFLARQPIFDTKYNVHGYELLFRDGLTSQAEYDSAYAATSHVMLTSLIDIGLQKVSSDNDSYINISLDYIEDMLDVPLQGQAITLEIKLDGLISDKIRGILTQLSSMGYRLAIDNFVPASQSEEIICLFDVLKCNTQKLTPDQLRDAASLAKRCKCKLILTHIENYQQISELKELNADYFQGFFLSKPDITKQTAVPTVLLPVIKTLSRILDPNLDHEELESLISSDVSLSYRVLRLINSAKYHVDDIDSISRAIVYLGREAIKNLAIIIILTGVDDKPSELAKLALVRAKMCEILARQINETDLNSYFTVGLLSILDALLDKPMSDVLHDLPINHELKEGLEREGFMGKTLQCVTDYEGCTLNEVNLPALKTAELTEYYIESVEWAEETFKGLSL